MTASSDVPPVIALPVLVEDMALTPAQKAQLRAEFDQGRGVCQHCKGRHARYCPRVRELGWHPNNSLAYVKFWPEGEWSDEHIIWPEDVAE